jgi:hypothetical protein
MLRESTASTTAVRLVVRHIANVYRGYVMKLLGMKLLGKNSRWLVFKLYTMGYRPGHNEGMVIAADDTQFEELRAAELVEIKSEPSPRAAGGRSIVRLTERGVKSYHKAKGAGLHPSDWSAWVKPGGPAGWPSVPRPP